VKAARWFGRGEVRVVDVPEPVAGPGQAVLRVGWCGICGTDLEEYRHGPVTIPTAGPHPLTGRSAPITLGHEFWGTVAEVGPGAGGLATGERVAPEVCLACGRCGYCRAGQPALCVDWATIGLHADGGLAEYALVPAAACARLPDPVGDEEAALVEPLEVAVRAVRHSGLRLGERAAVVGGGAIGLLVLQAALAAGAREVFVVEPQAARRRLAVELGAAAGLDPGEAGWTAELAERCDGLGPEVALECAGATGSPDAAVAAVRKGGRVVLVGVHAGAVPLRLLDVVLSEKQLVGSVQHDPARDLPAAIHLLASGQVRVRPLVTARVPLARVVEDGFEALARPGEQLKVLVGG
jgi:(R,R)-butanediol dehydrogenase/meso-butanediol dehydrogenase/diacetyl reductase